GYDLDAAGTGEIRLGAQADIFFLIDSNLLQQSGGKWIGEGDDPTHKAILPRREGTYSLFARIDHRVSSALAIDAAIRADYLQRRRQTGGDMTDPEPPRVDDQIVVSPQIGAIFSPVDRIDLKLSFAEGFADAPY